MNLPSDARIQPPRFAPEPFGLFPLPPELRLALEAEVAGLTFEPVPEVPVYDSDYGHAVIGGISASSGVQPSIGHAPMSQALYERFYAVLTPMIEAWAGCELEPTWGYGIRSYGRGCVLHLHRDRIDTHVISCIVHVEDRSEVRWPLDFIDHDGRHHQVFFEPGTVLFYESLCPHGRLVPFQGEHYRNLYFHWRPRGWDSTPLRGMRCKYPSLETALAEWQVPAPALEEAELAPAWRDWLLTNLSRGCDPAALGARALAEGLDADAVARLLQAAPRGQALPGLSVQGLHEAPLTRTEHHPRAWRLDTPLAQVYEIPDLLSAQECEGLIHLIDSSLQPSTVTIGPGDYRTSRTCHLRDLDAPLIGVLETRLAALIGVDPTFSEPLQGQRYDRGQYFRAHTDWFEPGSREFIEHTALGGQRTWTVMVYLNQVGAGGQTRFLHLGRTFTPVPGMGLAWNNLHADGSPNPATLHESLPVEEGLKYVITKWFRALPGRNG
ncbi:2OG-Fe(II) oxygenase [Cyanobium sp. FGCU-52]|nr:2OG-Fe(II) oxygenase [Cyanobium sp. FGCU52]